MIFSGLECGRIPYFHLMLKLKKRKPCSWNITDVLISPIFNESDGPYILYKAFCSRIKKINNKLLIQMYWHILELFVILFSYDVVHKKDVCQSCPFDATRSHEDYINKSELIIRSIIQLLALRWKLLYSRSISLLESIILT